MKEISLDKFKNSFALIADLVISLDEKNNAILKSRKEIEIYLKNKETFDKLHIVEELIYAYEAGAISESYLNNKEKDYWPKFTFERDCNRLMNSIKREIDRFQVNENDGRIQNLKEKIKALNTKSAKFNFLLEKKRNLEGDDPNWEILTNDKLYCWIKSELEYWEKFMEIPNGTVKQEPLPRLQTNLTNDRRASLFKLLSDSGFIPNTTDLDCFKWAIGVTDEKEPKQPGQWQPIQFLFDSKHSLRILLTPILGIITDQQIRNIKLLFKDKKEVGFILPKDQYRFSGDIDKIDGILKSLSIDKSNWYTGEKKQTN